MARAGFGMLWYAWTGLAGLGQVRVRFVVFVVLIVLVNVVGFKGLWTGLRNNLRTNQCGRFEGQPGKLWAYS